jgi:kinesin family protein 6/9
LISDLIIHYVLSNAKTGDSQNYEHRGVAPRALSHIFREVASRVEMEFKVTCTFVELYGEKIYDLLSDLSRPNPSSDFTIVEEVGGRGVIVRGLNEVEVRSENEALNLFFSGELAKTTAHHKLNKKSNRSHSIFTVYVQQRQRSGVSERVVHSKLHLVDLAGSERLKKTMDSSDGIVIDEVTKKESMLINQSLTFLEQCVIALARKGQSHIPYRQSKLTNMLKDALGANCNTLVIACIWGEASHLEETVSTLRLAARMMRVQNETSVVESVDSDALIRKQARTIRALKQELIMHDALVQRTGVTYDPYTPEQQAGIRQMVSKYIDATEVDEDDCLNIDSYRTMLEVCKQFKKIIIATRNELALSQEGGFTRSGSAPGGLRGSMPSMDRAPSFAADSKYEDSAAGNYVGDLEVSDQGRTGFSLGVAASDSKPSTSIDRGRVFGASSKSGLGSPGRKILGGDGPESTVSASQAGTLGMSGGMNLTSRADIAGLMSDVGVEGAGNRKALEQFVRTTRGRDVYENFASARGALRESKARAKALVQQINDCKAEIDALQIEVDHRKQSRIEYLRSSGMKGSDIDDIVDEEEYQVMKTLKEAKRAYKNSYEQLQKNKVTISEQQAMFDKAKEHFTSEFDEWEVLRERGLLPSSGEAGEVERLDDNEAFERISNRDPDSLAFFNAQKTKRANLTQNASSIRQILKSKRF